VIGHSGMCVLEAFLTFSLRRPGEKLRLSREAIAEAALLSPRTVGRTIRCLAWKPPAPDGTIVENQLSPRRLQTTAEWPGWCRAVFAVVASALDAIGQ
jgi:hypothetical protein